MSAPLPDEMAAVMRGWMSFALIVSTVISAPSAFPASDRLLLERLVGRRDEVHPADHVELLALGVGGSPAGGEDARQPGRGGARDLQERPAIHGTRHQRLLAHERGSPTRARQL